MVLSHAHLDHCGRLPLLVKRGFRGPVYAQEASCELVAILLADAAHLQERDAEYQSRKTGKRVKPLYTLAEGERVDAPDARRQVPRSIRGDRRRQGPFSRCRAHPRVLCRGGLGRRRAASERKIVFSGDLGQYDTPILRIPEPSTGPTWC